MADSRTVFEFLDRLIEQTRYGNVRWVPTSSPWEYQWSGTEASVFIKSMDEDGLLPVGIAITNADGIRVNSWVVNTESAPGEREFDRRVQELWSLVADEHDPVASLLRDLNNLPPF